MSGTEQALTVSKNKGSAPAKTARRRDFDFIVLGWFGKNRLKTEELAHGQVPYGRGLFNNSAFGAY
ncbi:hypothetical protein TH61_04740 [Rufibacter sp. DG15C]|nr:hypothetical protein TH61_04740 [Rufibacter sp. DG15C]